MPYVEAHLAKRVTDDGLFSVEDHVPDGKVYEVDLATRRIETFWNVTHNVFHQKEVVDTRDGVAVGFFVVELLDLPPSSITCPKCGMTSYNPHDINYGYCGHCHDWTGERRDV